MLFRGVPIPKDPLKMRRLIDWFFEDKKREMAQTCLLVKAATVNMSDSASVQELNKAMNEYRQTLFPTDKSNEEMMQRMNDYMESMEGKTLTVKPK